MKKSILLHLFFIFCLCNKSFSQWQWAQKFGASHNDYGQDICSDAIGNKYITGYFGSDSIAFGSHILTTNYFDAYLVKLDAAGNVLWARSSEAATSYIRGYSVAVDNNYNVFMVGAMNGDSVMFGSVTLYNNGGEDMFVVKYDSSGNVLWAKSAGRFANDASNGITTDLSGNAYVIGHYSSYIIFEDDTLQNAGGLDLFIAKYDALGNIVWVTSGKNAPDNDEGAKIHFDANNNSLYLTGTFSASIKFGNTPQLNGAAGSVFIAKYDENGNCIWAVSPHGVTYDYGKDITTDQNGNVYIVGDFSSSHLTFGSTTLTNSGNGNFFVAKLDSSGTFLWANAPDSTTSNSGFGYGVAVDYAGNSYITGDFGLGPLTVSGTVLQNNGGAEIYVIKYDTNGSLVWAQSIGRNLNENSYGINVDINNNLSLTGYFQSSYILFDGIQINNTSTFSTEIFLASGGTSTGIPVLQSKENNFKVYPNPGSEYLNISFDLKQPTVVSIQMVSLTGMYLKPLFNDELLLPGEHNFSIDNLPTGVYCLRGIFDGIESNIRYIKL